MILPIALTAAGAAALLNLWIGARVSQVRRVHGVAHGDGGNPALVRRMRAHANYVENAPFFLILVALIEFGGGRGEFLWAATIVFFLARLSHMFGMDRDGPHRLRIIGIVSTWTVIGVLAIWAIVLTYQGATPLPGRPEPPAATRG